MWIVLKRQRCRAQTCPVQNTDTLLPGWGQTNAGVVSGIRNLVSFEKNGFLCECWHGMSGWVCLKHRRGSGLLLTCYWVNLKDSISVDFYGWCVLCLINFGTLGTFCSSIKNYLGCLDVVLILSEQCVTNHRPVTWEGNKTWEGAAEMEFLLGREYQSWCGPMSNLGIVCKLSAHLFFICLGIFYLFI